MSRFEIVAHRGITTQAPENTLPAFERAVELGADAIEFDIHLTADGIPVVYHYYYLDTITTANGPIFSYTLAQLGDVCVHGKTAPSNIKIPRLADVLETFAGRIGLEIEIKGPEPEAPARIADVLRPFKHYWDTIEVTSYEPALLLGVWELCPLLAADLLYPRSEAWMKPDVVAYDALQLARLAHARAVHLHPTQLTRDLVTTLRRQGIGIHAWDVDDEQSLDTIAELGIPRICTNQCEQALSFRRTLSAEKRT